MQATHADQALTGVLRCRWSDLGATRKQQAATVAALTVAGVDVRPTGSNGPAPGTVADAVEVLEAARVVRSELATARARAARVEGRPAGTLGVGQVVDEQGNVWTDPEHPTVSRIVRRRLEGASFQTIADELADDMVPTGAGGAWHPFQVQRLWRRAQVTDGRPRATVDRGQRSTAGGGEDYP